MTRRKDWLPRLRSVLEEAQHERFCFGRYDCVHLVARALDAMTDSNWRATLPTYYSTAREAVRIAWCKGELERLISLAFNQQPQEISLARFGDVVALDLELGTAVGICVGERVAVASDGVLYLPLERAHCAWRI